MVVSAIRQQLDTWTLPGDESPNAADRGRELLRARVLLDPLLDTGRERMIWHGIHEPA
jgi:hypothetical protein